MTQAADNYRDAKADELEPLLLIGTRGVAKILDRHPRTVKKYAKNLAGFPKPIKPDGLHPMYLLSEVSAWLEARKAERDGRRAAGDGSLVAELAR